MSNRASTRVRGLHLQPLPMCVEKNWSKTGFIPLENKIFAPPVSFLAKKIHRKNLHLSQLSTNMQILPAIHPSFLFISSLFHFFCSSLLSPFSLSLLFFAHYVCSFHSHLYMARWNVIPLSLVLGCYLFSSFYSLFYSSPSQFHWFYLFHLTFTLYHNLHFSFFLPFKVFLSLHLLFFPQKWRKCVTALFIFQRITLDRVRDIATPVIFFSANFGRNRDESCSIDQHFSWFIELSSETSSAFDAPLRFFLNPNTLSIFKPLKASQSFSEYANFRMADFSEKKLGSIGHQTHNISVMSSLCY